MKINILFTSNRINNFMMIPKFLMENVWFRWIFKIIYNFFTLSDRGLKFGPK